MLLDILILGLESERRVRERSKKRIKTRQTMFKVADQADGIEHDITHTYTNGTANDDGDGRHVAGQLRQLLIPATLLPATATIPGSSSPILPATTGAGRILWRLTAKSRWERHATGPNL